MTTVELGFVEKCEPWKLQSRLFPSKVGGKPAWLSLKLIPTIEELLCEKCYQVMVFLCQIYAPYEDNSIDPKILSNNFHRTIFVFLCRNLNCNERNTSDNIRVFRSNLSRENDFYSFDPPENNPCPSFNPIQTLTLCNLCGILAEKTCSKCKNVFYCSREHQVQDWKDGHKITCSGNLQKKFKSKLLFSEWELVTEMEHDDDEDIGQVNVENELKHLEKLKAEGTINTIEASECDLESYSSSNSDKVFSKFKKVISAYPHQVIRYNKGGEPLLIAKEPLPLIIPNCECCGGPRQFEFQIMPQMLSILKENDLDWGVLLIYTCKMSCIGDSIYSYKKEFVFKQDVHDDK